MSLDADTRLLVEQAMLQRGLSFKEAINQAIRAGLAAAPAHPPSYTVPRALGRARVDLTKALALAGQLEDEALVHRLTEGR